MKQVTKENHLQLILIILLIVLITLFTKERFLGALSRQSQISPSPSPYILKPMSAEGVALQNKLTGDGAENKLLLDNDNFRITYISNNHYILVEVKGKPYEASKKMAQQWFVDQGFKDFDNCLLNIHFSVASDLSTTGMQNSQFVFDGCPVPENLNVEIPATESAY